MTALIPTPAKTQPAALLKSARFDGELSVSVYDQIELGEPLAVLIGASDECLACPSPTEARSLARTLMAVADIAEAAEAVREAAS